MPVAKKARAKTAFDNVTPFGLYQFRLMPFGSQGAPATFQRMMDQLLRGLKGYAVTYLDDLVIYSDSWEDNLLHIEKVFDRLREAGLTAKPKKCQFLVKQCIYLDQVVENGVIRPEQSKVEAVMPFPIPQTKKQVRAFLRVRGYYRKFILNFANIAAMLTNLIRKNSRLCGLQPVQKHSEN